MSMMLLDSMKQMKTASPSRNSTIKEKKAQALEIKTAEFMSVSTDASDVDSQYSENE